MNLFFLYMNYTFQDSVQILLFKKAFRLTLRLNQTVNKLIFEFFVTFSIVLSAELKYLNKIRRRDRFSLERI